ncbi:MAG: DUF4783 domain-containing protein [Saprospiraceae bacterium]
MKSLLFVLLLAPAFLANDLNINSISNAISRGDADTLGEYFAGNVELAIAGDEGSYSKTEAIQIVKKFFSTVSPKGFSQVHAGASKGNGSKYCIGDMTTSKGTYRVYIYLTDSVIEEFRADKA